MKDILIFGSTGSIGTQALDIIRKNPDKFRAVALTCNNRISELEEQIAEFEPQAICVGNEQDALSLSQRHKGLEVYWGEDGLQQIAGISADIALSALTGISGLMPTYEAVISGKDIALANKETLVTGGALITKACKAAGVSLLPVDSEHSAIFQCLEGNANRRVKRILLTASGGPFRGYNLDQLESVGIEQALNHPRWSMGSKVTIDSATMMNKGLEVIEARWLFDVDPDIIEIHVHPESIVHSMVEFSDTSIIAQIGLPDMRIPIGFAFAYPERLECSGSSLDFFAMASELHFEKPDREVFQCIGLAYDALKAGGSYPVVLNGANEELVKMFLAGRIKFLDIQRTLVKMLEANELPAPRSVAEVLGIDAEARKRVHELI